METPFTTLIEPGKLLEHLDRPELVLFDCRFDLGDTERGYQDYLKGHIPHAVYAHMDRDLSSAITETSGRHPLPNPVALIEWLKYSGVNNHSQVIAYDNSGGTMAVRIWWLLRWLGHTNVAILDGGWQEWTQRSMPIAQEIPKPHCGQFIATIDQSQVLETEQILIDLQEPQQQWLLIDARTSERYRGEHEPIDPVAGHIPGAVNLPLQDNLGKDGRFLAPHRLRSLYEPLIGQHPVGKIACYCGSGVTACHNLLALEIAGFRGARLYAGSWSEWIRDSRHPIATVADNP